MNSKSFVVIMIISVFLMSVIFLPVVRAEINNVETMNVSVNLQPGLSFTENDLMMNLANKSTIKTEYDIWVEDWGEKIPDGIFHGQFFPPARIKLDYSPIALGWEKIEIIDYFSFPKSVIMSGSWNWWVKSPLLNSTIVVYLKDMITGLEYQPYNNLKKGLHDYFEFMFPLLPDHLYALKAYGIYTEDTELELAHDPIYDFETSIRIYHFGATIEWQKTYNAEADWSFIFCQAIGNDGLFGMTIYPKHDKIYITNYLNTTSEDNNDCANVYIPFLSTMDVMVGVDFSYPCPDIPFIVTKNGYFASTINKYNYSVSPHIYYNITFKTSPGNSNWKIVLLCSAEKPTNPFWGELFKINGKNHIYFKPFVNVTLEETIIGYMTNYGNSTNVKIIDTGYASILVFTDTQIYVMLTDRIEEFIVKHPEILVKEKDEESFSSQILGVIVNFLRGIWDGIQSIAGWIYTGLMWIAKLIIEVAKFIWGVIVSFITMLIIWLGDVVHNLSLIFYSFFFAIPALLMMIGISYSARMIYFEEE